MRFPALGAIYVVPAGANPTPIPIAISKEVTANFKVTKKGLRGQWKWFIDVAEFANEATLKLKNADFRASVMQMLFTGMTSVAGQTLPATGEAATIGATPYQVAPSQAATFAEDGGVLDYTAGKWLSRVASGPTTGQYSVTGAAVGTGSVTTTVLTVSAITSGSYQVGQQITGTGVTAGTYIVSLGTGTGGTGTYNLNNSFSAGSTTITGLGTYTFAAADTGHNLSLVYAYTSVAGSTLTLNNATMGASASYAVRVYNQYTINGAVKAFGLKFPAVHFEGIDFALKSEDWAEQSLSGIVAQDPNSQLVVTGFVGD